MVSERLWGLAPPLPRSSATHPDGPLNKPVRVFNYCEFERALGGLHRDSLVSYAVRQFFLNGGGDAYVVRIAKDEVKGSDLSNTLTKK